MINALLVQYNKGWTERVDQAAIQAEGYRSEGLLTLGAISSMHGANRIADWQLKLYAGAQRQIVAETEPIGNGDEPYVDYRVGDTLSVPDVSGAATAQRVVAITMREDEDGHVKWTPSLHGVISTNQDRTRLAIKQMSNGTLGGTSKVSSPLEILPGNVTVINVAEPSGGGPPGLWAGRDAGGGAGG